MVDIILEKDSNVKANKIKVFGVGGAGGNAVARMIACKLKDVEYIVANTDAQVLATSRATTKIQIGTKLTHGQGAGANPTIGKQAAEEAIEEITAAIRGADLLFITAGMGGGTGTGAAPVIAKIAKDMGILTVAVVTKPFAYEGKGRMAAAMQGIKELEPYVDTLLVISNERVYEQVGREPIPTVLLAADDILRQGIQGISDIITTTGLINVDFADVCTVMRNAGYAHMGIGVGRGEKCAEEAAQRAVSSKLLETRIENATRLLINVCVSSKMSMCEIGQAVEYINNLIRDDNPHEIVGAVLDDSLSEDEMHVIVFASGDRVGGTDTDTATLTKGAVNNQSAPKTATASPVIESDIVMPMNNAAETDLDGVYVPHSLSTAQYAATENRARTGDARRKNAAKRKPNDGSTPIVRTDLDLPSWLSGNGDDDNN